AQDRTLFFDLLPFSLGAVSGYDFKIQLYTVPGQVQYNATRRVVLAGADAVVFVADARRSLAKENQAAFENMKVNLLANRLVPEKVPIVFQYNKQDLPEVMSVAELSKTINPWGRPALGAVAAQGQGVIECFVAVVQDMLAAIAVKYNLKEKGLDPASVPSVVQEAFAEVLKNAAAAAPAAQSSPAPRAAKVVVSHATDSLHAAPPQTGSETGLVSEELLHRSLRSNVELAESLSDMVREMNLGLGAILSQADLLMVHREDARDKRQAAILAIQQEATRLKKVVAELGDPSAASARGTGDPVGSSRPLASTPTMTSSRSIPSPPARAAAPPPVPRAAAPPVPPPSVARASLHELLQDVLGGAQDALDAQELSVDLRVPMTTSLPSCPPLALRQALVGTVEGLVTAALRGTQLSLRCERKPVLLKGRDGEVKRDFLMLALAHTGNLSPEDQQRVVQGTDPGPLGQATRLFREMGGFVRFAPLPGGALETRVFLPVA
ncbi:MAG TPA: GTPase domain-containing protein, partial [Vicinamibacteria bacterium]|nr:GTPase domain-containing protein [Vicinamibacteria bacterium]